MISSIIYLFYFFNKVILYFSKSELISFVNELGVGGGKGMNWVGKID